MSIVNFNLALRLLVVSQNNNVLFLASAINICIITFIYLKESKKSKIFAVFIILKLLNAFTELKSNWLISALIVLIILTYLMSYYNKVNSKDNSSFYFLSCVFIIVSINCLYITNYEVLLEGITTNLEMANEYFLFKLITLSPLMPYFISENEIMSNLFSLIDLIKIA